MNNGCYTWNWHECFDKSIFNPSGAIASNSTVASTTVAPAPTQPLFDDTGAQLVQSSWSEPQSVLAGTLQFRWTLQDVSTIRPRLIVDLSYELDPIPAESDNMYLGFGVAEQLMQGALIVCSPQTHPADPMSVRTGSTCKTYIGSGMGVKRQPENSDPVQPTVIRSEKNATHYTVQFSANLFGCWANPNWPARVLFSRGMTSGSGDPMPHQNSIEHRQAVTGIDFLSVVDATTTTPGLSLPPPLAQLAPISADKFSSLVPGTDGAVDILDGRVRVAYELLHYGNDFQEIIKIHLQNVPAFQEDGEHSYIGFGFAEETMTGLIMTCSPRRNGTTEVTARCQQWRGRGTNLYPLSAADPGGWSMESIEGTDGGSHVNLTLVGRARDVVPAIGYGGQKLFPSLMNMRAICAVGRAAADDSGNPLMHSSQDRTVMDLSQLATAAPP